MTQRMHGRRVARPPEPPKGLHVRWPVRQGKYVRFGNKEAGEPDGVGDGVAGDNDAADAPWGLTHTTQWQ